MPVKDGERERLESGGLPSLPRFLPYLQDTNSSKKQISIVGMKQQVHLMKHTQAESCKQVLIKLLVRLLISLFYTLELGLQVGT